MEGNLEIIRSLRDISKNHNIWTLCGPQTNKSQRMDFIWISIQETNLKNEGEKTFREIGTCWMSTNLGNHR